VQTSVTGRLTYVPDAEGDRILDFSSVGYQGRGVEAIPNDVANVVTVSAISGDDTANIQAAINQVSALPIGTDGFRGAVLLQAGSYDINTQLLINASGVVLRGEGSGATGGTILHGRTAGPEGTNRRPLIRVFGSGGLSNVGARRNLIDKVVPVGSTSFRVDVTSNFAPGDTVRVIRGTNAAWISALGTDMIPPRPDGGTVNQWTTSTINQRFDRVVTRVEGNRVFVDAPFPNAIEQEFGGGTIQKYVWPGAIENVGIENLRGESDFDSDTDEDHAWEFISIGNSHNNGRAQNVWVRDISGAYFGDSLVVANPGSKWVTVTDATSEDPKSRLTGNRRYTYDLSGELGLVANVQADEGRHDFVTNSTAPKGPNVFYNSTATNSNEDTGPHQRWSTGTLFDNITVQGDQINARNRSNLGTGHGWSGANIVVWNSTADSFIIQNPPTAQNWLVGSRGTIIEDTTFGPQPSGYYDQSGPTATPVTTGGTTSLYEAQVNDSRDISEFRLSAAGGNWNDAATWDQQLAPADVYTVSQRDYLQGDVDDYTNDGTGSVDDAFIDPAWETFVLSSSGQPVTGFDDVSTNQNVAYTIQHTLDSGEKVVHATLALALRQGGGNLNTDFVRVANASNQFDFNQLGWDTEINTTDSFVGVLDLGEILGDLQSGSVNVQVNDDSGVDWALYTVTVATPTSNPTATSVFIDGGGAVTVDTLVGPVGQIVLGGTNAGTLNLDSSGEVSVADDFFQFVNGTLAVELAGESDGQFGTLAIEGTASLSGTLEATLEGGFNPVAGTSLKLLTATNVVGTFDSLLLPALDEGLLWGVLYEADGVSLEVLFAADFTANGLVNEEDLLAWQAGFGSNDPSHSNGDSDGDSDVDGSDFLAWQRQFGNTTSGTLGEALAVNASVPEPNSVLLALVGAALCMSCKRRKRG